MDSTDHNHDVTPSLAKDLEEGRELMRKTKPKAYKKLQAFLKKQTNGDFPRNSLLDFGYSFDCNFSCNHCGTTCLGGNTLKNKKIPNKMPMDVVKRVADEADEAGFFTISFIGGETLLWPELEELVTTFDPSRFYITIATNGWLLDKEKAVQLKKIGVNKIGISIDSGIAEEHDSFRNKPGSFERALKAVRNSIEAGFRIHISTTVTHQNIRSKGIVQLLDLSDNLGVPIDLQCATVAGEWQENYEPLLTEEDANHIIELRNKYPLIRRDLFPTPGGTGGCPALTGSVFLTSSGEVLPCLFIHISLGNIYHDSLHTILDRGAKIKKLRENSKKCLAGEDMEFIEKYISRTFGKENLPLSYEDGFGA